MKNAIVHFYENLVHDDHPQRPVLDGIFYDAISMEDAIDLKKDFLEEEVRTAINDLGKEKAPGHGFNVAFFQHYWDVVEGDLMGFFIVFMREVFLKKV